MSESITYQKALVLLQRGYRHQMHGEFGDAIDLYRQSIAAHPTAEAHTYLGWAYSLLSRYEEAIEECRQAIDLDPTFGNPYNDIGSYLIELGRWEEAIPWLEQATQSDRQDVSYFPLINLGRAYEHLGRARTALQYYDRALEIDPLHRPTLFAKYALLGRLN